MKPIFSIHNQNEKDPIYMTILVKNETKEIIIGFSGTKGPSELIDEIKDMLPKKYLIHENKGAQVFSFFYHHYVDEFREIFFEKLTEIVSSEEYEDYKFVFTGHSLGGALCLHAAADAILMKILDKREVIIYTYGQPRIGNMEFFELFIDDVSKYYRLVHHHDIVPHVPPCIPDLRHGCLNQGILPIYPIHAPTEVFYDKDMEKYTVCSPGNGEDPRCSNKIINDSVDNHLFYFGIHVGHLYQEESEELVNSEAINSLLKSA